LLIKRRIFGKCHSTAATNKSIQHSSSERVEHSLECDEEK
jgi:hypothetical protein